MNDDLILRGPPDILIDRDAKVNVNTARVWTARGLRGMSTKEAAAALGIPVATFRKWQSPSGYSINLTPEEIRRIAAAFHVLPGFLTDGDEDECWQNLYITSMNIAWHFGEGRPLPGQLKRAPWTRNKKPG